VAVDPQLSGEAIPDFGHAFANLTHFPTTWQSLVEFRDYLAKKRKKERKKEHGNNVSHSTNKTNSLQNVYF